MKSLCDLRSVCTAHLRCRLASEIKQSDPRAKSDHYATINLFLLLLLLLSLLWLFDGGRQTNINTISDPAKLSSDFCNAVVAAELNSIRRGRERRVPLRVGVDGTNVSFQMSFPSVCPSLPVHLSVHLRIYLFE